MATVNYLRGTDYWTFYQDMISDTHTKIKTESNESVKGKKEDWLTHIQAILTNDMVDKLLQSEYNASACSTIIDNEEKRNCWSKSTKNGLMLEEFLYIPKNALKDKGCNK